MRNKEEQKKLQQAKKESKYTNQQVVLQTKKRREFFRFQEQELAEYDLTKYAGRQIKLTDEEKPAIEEFPFVV